MGLMSWHNGAGKGRPAPRAGIIVRRRSPTHFRSLELPGQLSARGRGARAKRPDGETKCGDRDSITTESPSARYLPASSSGSLREPSGGGAIRPSAVSFVTLNTYWHDKHRQ